MLTLIQHPNTESERLGCRGLAKKGQPTNPSVTQRATFGRDEDPELSSVPNIRKRMHVPTIRRRTFEWDPSYPRAQAVCVIRRRGVQNAQRRELCSHQINGARIQDASSGKRTSITQRKRASFPQHPRSEHPKSLAFTLRAGRQAPFFPKEKTGIGSGFPRGTARRVDLAGIATKWGIYKGTAPG